LAKAIVDGINDAKGCESSNTRIQRVPIVLMGEPIAKAVRKMEAQSELEWGYQLDVGVTIGKEFNAKMV
jgi:hypothetical protein